MASSTSLKKFLLVVGDDAFAARMADLLDGRYDLGQALGAEAVKARARGRRLDLILLELASFAALDTCRAVRADASTRDVPVVVVAKDDSDACIEAFDAGADDFVPRDVSSAELLARVQSKIWRGAVNRADQDLGLKETLECGNLVLDLVSLGTTIGGRKIELSALEFAILCFLVRNLGLVLSREQLVKGAWPGRAVSIRAVDTHVWSLRKRLAGCDCVIESIYGAGYVLKPRP